MPHLDEGMIHAWLDGALTDVERAQAETHAAGCEICSAAVAEARGLVAASSRILSALDDVPAGVIPVAPHGSDTVIAANTGVKARTRLWFNRPMLRAAAALLLVTTGTFFVASREGANRELNVATDTSESTVAAVGAAAPSGAQEVAVVEDAVPQGKLQAPVPLPARNPAPLRTSPPVAATGKVAGSVADGAFNDSTRGALADIAIAPAGRARIERQAANQTSADAASEQRRSAPSRGEAPPLGRPGSITQMKAREAGYAASTASSAKAERDVAAVRSLAGCYEIRLGTWTPALTLGADEVYITPPPQIVLDTLSAVAPADPSRFRVLPVLDTPGRDYADWLALTADSLRVTWTTGLHGLTMHLKLENRVLSGFATTFWNFDRKSQRSEVTGKRIVCQ
ncbi:MAG: zf-HC2 domain-containing protein [Anaerolineae bacterium]|nr:zf-HC2 domain-containing protein [Gemmatimonadaceae bacterium]